MVSVFFAVTVNAKARQTTNLYDNSHHLSEPLRRSRNYAGVISISPQESFAESISFLLSPSFDGAERYLE